MESPTADFRHRLGIIGAAMLLGEFDALILLEALAELNCCRCIMDIMFTPNPDIPLVIIRLLIALGVTLAVNSLRTRDPFLPEESPAEGIMISLFITRNIGHLFFAFAICVRLIIFGYFALAITQAMWLFTSPSLTAYLSFCGVFIFGKLLCQLSKKSHTIY